MFFEVELRNDYKSDMREFIFIVVVIAGGVHICQNWVHVICKLLIRWIKKEKNNFEFYLRIRQKKGAASKVKM